MWFLNSWASCCTPLILVLEGQRQEDLSELKASLVYKEFCLEVRDTYINIYFFGSVFVQWASTFIL